MHPRASLKSSRFQALTIFIMVCAFIAFGLLMVYNVSVVESFVTFGDGMHLARQQAMWAGLAVLVMIICAKVPTKLWVKLGPLIFLGSVVLMIAVLIPGVGVRVLGAKRWLSFGGWVVQPVEFLKIGLVLYLSTWLAKERRFSSFISLIIPLFGLIMLQPDLGSGLIMLSIASSMYVVSGKPFKHIIWMAVGGGIGLLILILISPYRLQRLTTYLNPESDPLGKSYHIRQITLALGNGGIFGQGLGQSKQKYRYIPEATTDSIFAILAEELGFFWCGIIIIGYITLLLKMTSWIKRVEHIPISYLLGVGIISWIAAQVLVNLSSVVALIPLTGVPLPFLSYGGSALVTLCIAIGMLLGTHPQGQEKTLGRVRHRSK